MNKPKHTELPWELARDKSVIISRKGKDILVTSIDTKNEMTANAEFIVKACNNHYQLLEALKELSLVVRTYGFREPNSPAKCLGALDKALETIKQAEGK